MEEEEEEAPLFLFSCKSGAWIHRRLFGFGMCVRAGGRGREEERKGLFHFLPVACMREREGVVNGGGGGGGEVCRRQQKASLPPFCHDYCDGVCARGRVVAFDTRTKGGTRPPSSLYIRFCAKKHEHGHRETMDRHFSPPPFWSTCQSR